MQPAVDRMRLRSGEGIFCLGLELIQEDENDTEEVMSHGDAE